MAEILIPISLFATLFGIFYLFYSTRNKERLALIEKGADASIFGKNSEVSLLRSRLITMNISLLLMGIGLGVFFASLLETYTDLNEAIYPALIFFMGGLGLFVGFLMTKKLQQEEK